MRFDVNTLPCVNGQWGPAVWHRELSSVLCDDLAEWDGRWWEGGPRGGDLCTHTADSLHCTAETNTALQSNYTPIKDGFSEKVMALFTFL